MPPQVDLEGRRFGALIALSRTSHATTRSIWLCLCDCGRETLVPLDRLSISDDNPRAIRACEICRSRPCVICGTLFLKPGSAKTCGADACRLANRRIVNARAAAAAELRTPGAKERRQMKRLHLLRAEHPDRYAALLEADREAQRKRRSIMTPEDKAVRRAYRRERYDEHREIIRAKYQRWLDAMPPERRREWDRKMAAASRAWRSRQSVARLLRQATQLMNRMEDGE